MLLPVVYGIILGDQEIYGSLDESGNFRQIDDPTAAEPQLIQEVTTSAGLLIPCKAEIIDIEGNSVAVVEIEVVEGSVACTNISALPGHELTGQLLRQAPIKALVRAAAEPNVVHFRHGFAVRFAQGSSSFAPGTSIPDLPRRRVLDPSFLERVAGIYRDAVRTGMPTGEQIQKQLGPISDAGARRWVSEARKAGFLGQAIGPWKAGELTPHSRPTAL